MFSFQNGGLNGADIGWDYYLGSDRVHSRLDYLAGWRVWVLTSAGIFKESDCIDLIVLVHRLESNKTLLTK